MINVKNLMLPLIQGMKGVNDNNWKVKVTASCRGFATNIVFSNELEMPNTYSYYENRYVRFDITFKVIVDGTIEYYRSSVPRHSNRGGKTQERARAAINGYFGHLRQELRAA